MKKFLKSLVCTAALVLFATSAFANDYVKFKGWKQAETTHFRFIYEAASEEAAKKYAEFADEAWEKIAQVYSMPQEKTNVYVFSRLNIVNAYTFFTPPEIVMFDSPVLNSYFSFRDDWMKLFFTHELIHIANITFEDKKYLTSKLFGEAFRGWEYSMIPGWALEGLTTVLETELTNGGRGRSPYFELEFKTPTMDNNLIPYRLIGTDQEPPYGQIYIMGYLIMRSIADRWGLQALADIERNRNTDRSWEESVKLVTGHTPQDIYREVKIALEKKYAKEREIPEGKIISPNEMNQHYYKPGIILDDGTIVTLKDETTEGGVAVILKPGAKDGSQYIEDSEKEEKEFKETILFKGAEYITADENLNVYSTTYASRYDRSPYNETKFGVYKWTKEDGNVLLTNDESSYYQVAVSRDGSLLVGVEQKGLKMRIVKIDTQTGATTVLFEDERYSFVQPALNADGSKIAFLLLKDDRACVALGNPLTGEYKIVNNTEHEFITDPSNPSFNKDGTLTFCSNDRGRLEIYEAIPNSDGQTFTCTPKLSDPIAALWAYKNDMAIFYTSQASTGNVIKIKPLEEWGNVPDFDGPSPAGEIMTFGKLEDDYPDFDPYKALALEQAESEDAKTTESNTADTDDDTKDSEEEDPVKHRSQEMLDKLENLEPAVTELTNEKRFVPYISPLMYMPFFNILSTKDDMHFGIGGFFAGMLPRYQMKQGIIFVDAFYYPTINNFTGEFLTEIPLFAGTLDFLISRNNFSQVLEESGETFSIMNLGMLGYTLPIISREQYTKATELNYLAYAECSFTQTSEKAFAINENLPFTQQLNFQTGIDYYYGINYKKDDVFKLGITNLATATWDFTMNKLFVGYEGEFLATLGNQKSRQEADLIIRYTDFPAATAPTLSRAHFNSLTEDCLFPGKILLSYTSTIPNCLAGMMDASFVVQGLASFGKNTVDGQTPETGMPLNFNLEKKLNLGFELSMSLGTTQKLALGISNLFDFSTGIPVSNWDVYVSCKFNWLRF